MIQAIMLLVLVVGIPYGMGAIGATFDSPVAYGATFAGALGLNAMIAKWLAED